MSFQASQPDAYLQLMRERAANVDLVWVEQALDIIDESLGPDAEGTLNDVGCNVGLLWKGLRQRRLRLEYRGFDVEPQYLVEAVKFFPELEGRLFCLDVAAEAPPAATVGVMSATLEHLPDLRPGLDHLLSACERLAVVRTHMADAPSRSVQKLAGAENPYFAHTYSFHEVLSRFDAHGLTPRVVRDAYTDSLPVFLENGLLRTTYLVVGTR